MLGEHNPSRIVEFALSWILSCETENFDSCSSLISVLRSCDDFVIAAGIAQELNIHSAIVAVSYRMHC